MTGGSDGYTVPITPVIGGAKGGDKLAKSLSEYLLKGASDFADKVSSPEFQSKLNGSLTKLGAISKGDVSGIENPEAKTQAENFKMMSQGLDRIGDTFKTMLTKSFDVLDTIYKELKKSSPLLQAVEQLFNLAMQLFFMPLGNKLGEVLIPAVIELLDGVMAFWEEYGDGGLDELFGHAISYGVDLLSTFILKISDTLMQQHGLLGSIGVALDAIGRFVQNGLEKLLTGLTNLLSFVIQNLKHILSAIIAFKVASLTMQLETMWVIATGETIAGKFGAGIPIAAAAGAAIASEAAMSDWGLAEGGYVPATDGGMMVRVAEGGQGEYVIPESRVVPLDQALSSVGSNVPSLGSKSGNSYIVNVYSYSIEEIKTIIKDVISDEISQSRLRSGY